MRTPSNRVTLPHLAAAVTIWRSYERQMALLAAQGAHVIVLAEKIAPQAPLEAQQTRRRLAAPAAKHGLWIEAGIGIGIDIDDGIERRSPAWLFSPDGALAAHYQKHFLAPGCAPLPAAC